MVKENNSTIHIEMCKSKYHKGKWKIRIGDIKGSIDSYNLTLEEVLEEIKDHMEGKYDRRE